MTTSVDIPAIGAGTYRLTGKIAWQSVRDALELGYRHIDTAQVYDNEQDVGKAIIDTGVKREDVFLTTKVWNDRLSPKALLDSVRESLHKLKTDYVDLLLVHWPSPDDGTPMADYLQQMLKAKELGYTRHIGVSNFTIANLQEALPLLPAGTICTNQIEVHPYLTNENLRNFCRSQNIHVTGYMPFAVGKVLKDPVIMEIAGRHNVSTAEVVIAWAIAHNMATIPSSTKRENLKANLNGTGLTLSIDELSSINQLNRNARQANPDFSPEWDL